MNDLDLLKTHWQKDNDYIKFKKEDIMTMVHKSSSSIVKWIFIITLLEFTIIVALNIASYIKDTNSYGNSEWLLMGLYFIIMIYFMYSFYKYFKQIKNSNNIKQLLKGIVSARKQTLYFISTNIIIFILNLVFSFIYGDMIEAFKKGYYDANNKIPDSLNEFDKIAIYIGTSMGVIVMLGIVYLYYNLIYLRLTKKLHKNYEELIELEK